LIGLRVRRLANGVRGHLALLALNFMTHSAAGGFTLFYHLICLLIDFKSVVFGIIIGAAPKLVIMTFFIVIKVTLLPLIIYQHDLILVSQHVMHLGHLGKLV
jgi:hypothetical protein